MQYKVFITTKIPDKGIELLKKQGYEVEIGALDQNLSQKEIMEKGKGADALLSQLEDVIDGRVMNAIGPQLKVIANYAVGYDNVDLKEAKKRNILVCNTSYFINTARGAVVDETALVEALQKKQIQGAAIDVFESEPTVPPGIDTLDNLVITPHIGSASKEARDAMAELAARNIIAVLSGEKPIGLVKGQEYTEYI